MQVTKLLVESKQRVIELLTLRKAELQAVAEALISRETLNADEIREICESVEADEVHSGPGGEAAPVPSAA